MSGFEVDYVFLDAVFEVIRRYNTTREGILCAWAILTDGRKVLLHMALGNKESYSCWLDLLRDMVRRGLRTPLTVTTDGAPGLLRAVQEVWQKSVRIRCWVHKMRNLMDKLPESARPEMKAHFEAIRDAATLEAGEHAAAQVLEKFGRTYPSAMACLSDDLVASLAHLRLPVTHRKFVRTTNLIERSFGKSAGAPRSFLSSSMSTVASSWSSPHSAGPATGGRKSGSANSKPNSWRYCGPPSSPNHRLSPHADRNPPS